MKIIVYNMNTKEAIPPVLQTTLLFNEKVKKIVYNVRSGIANPLYSLNEITTIYL